MSTFYVKGKYTYIEHPDIRYVTNDDNGYFAQWLRWRYGFKHDIDDVLSFLRALTAMIADGVPDAFIVDQDALLPKAWHIDTESDDMFMSLGPGVVWCTREFAVRLMNNLNISENADVIIDGFLQSQGITANKFNVAHKVSRLTSWEEPVRSESALAFIHGYGGLPEVKFADIVEEYEQYLLDKRDVEDKFKAVYGIHVDIKRFSKTAFDLS